MKKPDAQPPLDMREVRKILERCDPADFQGRIPFERLTPSQRLDALAGLAVFVHQFKGIANRPSQKKGEGG